MKKKNISKKVLAILLSVVMLMTSIPAMVVGAIGTGSYDPAPYWGNDQLDNNAAVNTKLVATVGDDGSVSISFPKATPSATWNTYTSASPTKKQITNYIFTLTKMADDGTRQVIWSENFENKNYTSAYGGVFTITEGAEYSNNIYYGPGGLTSLTGYDVSASYDVGIVAVDSDGWVSDAIHTRLTSVPYYNIDTDFSPDESWVVREMLLFENSGSAKVNNVSQSSNGNEGSARSDSSPDEIDYMFTGSGVKVTEGKFSGMGYDASNGYRFWIETAYPGTPFALDTTWSRTHYDFKGAEEVWFYVDFSRVDLANVSFTLAANEKDVEHWRDDTTNYASQYGAIFSTKAVNGVNTGVKDGIYIQNADGLWEETSMNNGCFNELGGYKGFIRIPIDYFILQSDQYIVADNDMANWSSEGNGNATSLNNYANKHYFASGATMVVPDSDGKTRTLTTTTYDSKVAFKINEAGTSVCDSYIIYDRTEKSQRIFQTNTHEMGPMISDSNVVSVSGTTYTITSPQFAIQDLVSAGIQVEGWSNDSVGKAFYIDQIMFCQKNTGGEFDSAGYVMSSSAVKFPQEGSTTNSSGTADLGRKMAGFYDRTVEVPKAVAEYIMEYFGEIPSLDDINAKKAIDDVIETYMDCFPNCTTVEQAVASMKTTHTDAYNRYIASKTFIDTYVGDGLDVTTTAVESFENGVEALPNPDFADYKDESLTDNLKQLMALYETFNLSHYELLGAEAEAKFLELYSLVMGEDVKTGQSIGAFPYIPFNDFETNYTYGQLADFYYDDANRSSEDNKQYDVNNTKNLVTYITTETINQASALGSGDAVGWSVQDYRPGNSNIFSDTTYFGRVDAQITEKGFADTMGVTLDMIGDMTINFDSDGKATDKKFATLSTTYLGQNADSWSNLKGLNLSGLQLSDTLADGTTAKDNERYGQTSTGEQITPNSFVMYVDLSQVKNVAMNIKFIVADSSGNDKPAYFCGGSTSATPTIYVLDENGEWTTVQISASNIDEDSTWFETGLCSIATDGTALEGYKGFIRIPLSMFRINKTDGLEENYYILDNNLNNYTIKQVKVSVWDYDSENVNIGKEIQIDEMGFTYDPRCTTRSSSDPLSKVNSDNGIEVKNMDEHFGVKTTDSSNFEKLVAEIDPYAGWDAFEKAYDKAVAAYEALSDYQKTEIEEVDYAYRTLLLGRYEALYNDYENVIQEEQWRPLYTATTDDSGNVTATAVDNLLTALGTVSSKSKSYSTTKESLLDLYNTHKTDYMAALGFTSLEEAQAVIDMYELGYCRLSVSDRDTVSDDDTTSLLNAYNAAQRAILVNGIIGDVDTFKDNITKIYGTSTHTDDDADRIPDTEDTDNELRTVQYDKTITVKDENNNDVTVNALGYYIDMYEDISIFGKKLLDDDTDTAALYMNMYAAAEAVYDNSTEIKPRAGNSVEGGIVTYKARMEEAYKDVKAKIDAKTVLDSTTLNEIEYCLGQYEAFKPRYAQVDELNYAYVQLALLLPTADLATTDTVYLTNSDTAPLYSDAANADLTYVAARLNRTVSVYVVTDYKWTQSGNGAPSYDFGYFSVNGATGTETTYTKLGDYANGATAALAPTVSVDEAKAKKVPTGAMYEGTVTLVAFDSAQITDGVDLSTLEPVATVEIPVQFNSVNGSDPIYYTVEIPADMAVDWGTAETDVSYTIKNASLNGGTLTVGVADNTGNFNPTTNKGELRNGDNALAYTANNFGDTEFSENITTDTTPNPAPEVVIAQDDWDEAAVGEYRTTLTYTVVYDDGTT